MTVNFTEAQRQQYRSTLSPAELKKFDALSPEKQISIMSAAAGNVNGQTSRAGNSVFANSKTKTASASETYAPSRPSGKISHELHQDIKGVGTSKEIFSHIDELNPDNISDILNNYQKSYGNSLIHDISREYEVGGLSLKDRIKLINKIKDVLFKKAESLGIDTKVLNEEFAKELDAQKNCTGRMDTKKLDSIINLMTSAIEAFENTDKMSDEMKNNRNLKNPEIKYERDEDGTILCVKYTYNEPDGVRTIEVAPFGNGRKGITETKNFDGENRTLQQLKVYDKNNDYEQIQIRDIKGQYPDPVMENVTEERYVKGRLRTVTVKDYTDNNGTRTIFSYNGNGKLASKATYIQDSHLMPSEQKVSEMVIYNKNGTETVLTFPTRKEISENHFVTTNNGISYDIQINKNMVTVKNQQTGQAKEINLDNILKNMSPKQKEEVANVIKQMNGENLMDLAVELDSIYHLDNDIFINSEIDKFLTKWLIRGGNAEGKSAGKYNKLTNNITTATSLEVLVHELGHAVDYKSDFPSTNSANKEFMKIFNEEMSAYLADGNKKSENGAYCTTNKDEMFAECYTFLTTGSNESSETIVKYFPRTLLAIKQLIENIRNQPESERK